MKPKSLLTSFDPPPPIKNKNEVCLEGKNAMKIYHYKQQTGFFFYTTIFKIAINPKISIYTEMIIYISYEVFSAIKKDHDVHVSIYFVHSTIIYSLSSFLFYL